VIVSRDTIINEIALQYDIPVDVVSQIVNSQFSFVANVISKGDRTNPDTLKNVNLQYFGKFAVKEARKRYYKKVNDRTESDD
jgi:nucleoid DNA-binding protein